jgi:Arc/MetJ-type ribon-helix-helix transcriptional regulator
MFQNGELKRARIAVRLSPEDQLKIENARKARGYANVSTFIRTAIDNEIGRRTELVDVEQKIAASFDRMSRDIFRLDRGQRALFTLIDTLSKTLLTCVPEPPAEKRLAAIALAKSRYDRLMKSAGRSMEDESRFAMEALIESREER